jgi:hypothetical protein
MNEKDIRNMINSNKGALGKLRDKKSWEYERPYPCIFTNAKLIGDDKVAFDIAIETAPRSYVNETFWFRTKGNGALYLEQFLDKAIPDTSEELDVSSILGKSFIGKVVANGDFTNIEAIDASTDFIYDDNDFVQAGDDEELPFN